VFAQVFFPFRDMAAVSNSSMDSSSVVIATIEERRRLVLMKAIQGRAQANPQVET
jgi:hypothetical protein